MNADVNFQGGSLRHDGITAIGDMKPTIFDCPVLIVHFTHVTTTHLDSTTGVSFSGTFNSN